jgi:VCBS repeat-containing protein
MGSAHNEFRAGVTYTDTLTARMADGTSQAVTVSTLGTNDAAAVSGTSTASITETNYVQSASGTLLVSDVDSTASFVAQPGVAGSNGYGTFSLTTAGAWTYTMSTAHNEFVKDKEYTDTFTAVTADGTTQSVVVTLTGTNDPAVISAPVVTVNETNAPVTATGTLTISDTDSPLTFVAHTSRAGTYGTFNLTTAGVWTYTASSAYDYLNLGNTLTDTFSLASYDGTTSSVTVKIAGTNDAPVMSASTASVTLNQGATAQTIATVSATDIDPVGTLSYSISRENGDASLDYFSVDKTTGALKFLAPAALSSAVDAVDLYNNTTGALGSDGYMDSPYKVHVIATDAYGAYSTSEEIKVNIKMAVAANGLSAELPSTTSYWTFAPQTTAIGDGDGFLMTSTSNSSI